MSNQDEFLFSGVSYVAVEADGCKLCEFHYRKNACRVATYAHIPPCRKEDRSDNRAVIFINGCRSN